ncbi:GNAT family N-acetyltransferase [Actinacidiphila sp. ITFR-21]|uniref:GNAT family N-acetyltransferase n=1 Tax=Actinacidiphila sp. ITFR-21 TaxID=3075199 RepID=UPI00288A06C6|nr:GNAT family N-acetyltransferase [Streptomyces sp. ITFR-21]WNI20091.1 GNAT family N-acetyltransferase [Streptomyces sp. ITFR-21]
MLAMRPARPEDRRGLEAMIRARSDWMKDNRLANWRSWGKHVDELAANCASCYGDMWVLTEDDDKIVGCTTILRTAAPWAWTAKEAAEPAFYLNATVTDPAERHRKLGTLIASWAVDRAARENISGVRRDCTSPALAKYYEEQQFRIVRRVSQAGGKIVFALERTAEVIPELNDWFSSGGPATAPRGTQIRDCTNHMATTQAAVLHAVAAHQEATATPV